MVSFCLQFVESFGNQSLQLPGHDSKSRLKLAVKYLLLAAQLFAMNRDLLDNPQAMVTYTADPSFSFTGCPETLESLLLATSSSSVFGSDDKSRPSRGGAEATESKVSAPPKGKPATISKKTSEPISATATASSPGRPTVRDAVLLLSSLTREALPFCSDSIEYALQSDLRELIRTNYEPIRKKYFLKEFPTFLNSGSGSGSGAEDEIVVPESSVTILWRPTSEPLPSEGPSSRSGESEREREQRYRSRHCLFPNAIGYFLLAPVKDPTSSTLLSPSAEPFLTKTLLGRSQLMETELFFRRIKEKFLLSAGGPVSSSTSSLHEMKSVSLLTLQQEMTLRLRSLFFLLRGIEPTKRDADLLTVQEMREEGGVGEGGGQVKSYLVSLGGAKVCEMKFSEEVLDSLIAILSKDRVGVTMACERSVLLFLWSALRV
jgi:hypothetical protein